MPKVEYSKSSTLTIQKKLYYCLEIIQFLKSIYKIYLVVSSVGGVGVVEARVLFSSK
jgi:hypothetical protein